MNKLDAYKMDGLGNDFIIFDIRRKFITLTKKQILEISDRKNIGCDQVIFIDNDKNNDANLTFYNSDGSEVGACGNGSRCVAYILMMEKNIQKISLNTKGGILKAELEDNLVSINMGSPIFDWKKIPLNKEMDNKYLKIIINDKNNVVDLSGFSLSIGNSHIVFFVNNLNIYDLKKIGPQIENHEYFPEKCNVTFAKIVNKKHLKVKVWERGAGLTKACGTAACATVVASSFLKFTDRVADVEFVEGLLNINWKLDNNVCMKGKVSKINNIIVKF